MSQPRPLSWLRAGQSVSNPFMLSAKQSSRTSTFNVFCLTRPGSNHQPPACQANAQPLHYPAAVNYLRTYSGWFPASSTSADISTQGKRQRNQPENLLSRLLSNFSCGFPWAFHHTFFEYLKNKCISKLSGFFFSFGFRVNHVNMGHYGSQNFKNATPPPNHFWFFFKLFLNFLLSGPHKNTVLYFWNFKFLIFHDFFSFSLTWQPKLQNATPPSSKKVLFWIFEILGFSFFTIYFRKFKVHHYILCINWKVRDRHVVTIHISLGKPYMENLLTPSHLTLDDLEGHSQGHSDFDALYLVKEQSYATCYY